jgi:hypothetical protein
MRADNSRHILAAARRRAAATRKRAVNALRRMDKAGLPITFDALAREAGVSRSWLYDQPDLRAEVERLRARQGRSSASRAVPDRQRASDASLLRRLEIAVQRIQRLEVEIGNSAKRSLWRSANAASIRRSHSGIQLSSHRFGDCQISLTRLSSASATA